MRKNNEPRIWAFFLVALGLFIFVVAATVVYCDGLTISTGWWGLSAAILFRKAYQLFTTK